MNRNSLLKVLLLAWLASRGRRGSGGGWGSPGPRLPRGGGGWRPRRPGGRFGGGTLVLLIAAAIFLYYQHARNRDARERSIEPAQVERPTQPAPAPRGGGGSGAGRVEAEDGGIAELFRSRRSDALVEAAGVVLKVLPDDETTSDGSSRHQRFTVQFPGGNTVLLAHNVDVAPRVPIRAGDRVRFRGEYEWNDRGGIIHWTHRDPAGRHEHGWIEHDGKRYD